MPSQSIEKMFILVLSLTMVSIIVVPTIGQTIQYLLIGDKLATLDSITGSLNTYLAKVENNQSVEDIVINIPQNYTITAESNIIYIKLLTYNATRKIILDHSVNIYGFNGYGDYRIHALIEDSILKVYFNKIR